MFTTSFYRPNFAISAKEEWLQKFDRLLLKIIATWSSNTVMGDFNLDLIKQSDNICTKYNVTFLAGMN